MGSTLRHTGNDISKMTDDLAMAQRLPSHSPPVALSRLLPQQGQARPCEEFHVEAERGAYAASHQWIFRGKTRTLLCWLISKGSPSKKQERRAQLGDRVLCVLADMWRTGLVGLLISCQMIPTCLAAPNGQWSPIPVIRKKV